MDLGRSPWGPRRAPASASARHYFSSSVPELLLGRAACGSTGYPLTPAWPFQPLPGADGFGFLHHACYRPTHVKNSSGGTITRLVTPELWTKSVLAPSERCPTRPDPSNWKAAWGPVYVLLSSQRLGVLSLASASISRLCFGRLPHAPCDSPLLGCAVSPGRGLCPIHLCSPAPSAQHPAQVSSKCWWDGRTKTFFPDLLRTSCAPISALHAPRSKFWGANPFSSHAPASSHSLSMTVTVTTIMVTTLAR